MTLYKTYFFWKLKMYFVLRYVNMDIWIFDPIYRSSYVPLSACDFYTWTSWERSWPFSICFACRWSCSHNKVTVVARKPNYFTKAVTIAGCWRSVYWTPGVTTSNVCITKIKHQVNFGFEVITVFCKNAVAIWKESLPKHVGGNSDHVPLLQVILELPINL